MAKRTCLAVILAAGEGTRMKSALPKVLHKVAGLPMLGHVLAAAKAGGATATAVVIGPGADATRSFVAKAAPEAECFVQELRLGTAHAVLAAREAIAMAKSRRASSRFIAFSISRLAATWRDCCVSNQRRQLVK